MQILLTGGNGLLGQTYWYLFHKNAKIAVTGRGTPKHAYRSYTALDVCNIKDIDNTFRAQKPDIVLHCAAMTNVDDCEKESTLCYQNNTIATQNILTTCQKYKVFLIFLSTDFVFDGAKKDLYIEDDAPNPLNIYGKSKQKAEALIRKSSYDAWAIVRTSLVYGTVFKQEASFLSWVKARLITGKCVNLVNDQWRCPTHVSDLAQACHTIAKTRNKGIFHVVGNNLCTPYAWVLPWLRF